MYPLLNAIVTRFTAASLPASITGGIHAQQALHGTLMSTPYLVVTPIGSSVDQTYGGIPYTVPVQFQVFGVGHDTVGALAVAAFNAYKAERLTLTGATFCSVAVAQVPVPILQPPSNPQVDENAAPVWGWMFVLNYTVS